MALYKLLFNFNLTLTLITFLYRQMKYRTSSYRPMCLNDDTVLSRCSSSCILSWFFARWTSNSVTLEHSRILAHNSNFQPIRVTMWLITFYILKVFRFCIFRFNIFNICSRQLQSFTRHTSWLFRQSVQSDASMLPRVIDHVWPITSHTHHENQTTEPS